MTDQSAILERLDRIESHLKQLKDRVDYYSAPFREMLTRKMGEQPKTEAPPYRQEYGVHRGGCPQAHNFISSPPGCTCGL